MNTISTEPGATALRRYEDLPSPPALPIVGHLLSLDRPRLHQQMEAWARQYGPLYRLRLGRFRLMVVGEHKLVAQVLRDRPDGFRRTERLGMIWTEMGLPVGVFGANGEAWARQRRMVMASFDPAHVRHYFPSMLKVAERLRRRWQGMAERGEAIQLQPELMRYTVDTIAGLAFGAEVNTLESDEDIIQQHLDKIFPALFRRILTPLPTWRWWPSQADRELKQSIPAVLAAVDGFIAAARARMAADPARREQPANLLEAMIKAADEPGSGIQDGDVAGNVLTMLLAGEDTTANSLAWLIELLWQHPECLARLEQELATELTGSEAPTLEQLGRLDYLEACIHESMRLKPVAPQIPLQALRDTQIGDVQVRAGQIVISLMRSDSVSEQHLKDASRFLPERWLSAGGDSGESAAPGLQASAAKRIAMPFGAGPRICPGRYLALLEMKLAMATLLRHFRIGSVDTPDGQAAAELLAFTMTPVGLSMRLKPR
ncbi:cytochrome P450 [Paucibacter sp. APW11]|uniref:Cytochrome P450 n=1 Tax=Roseateles aquae TaxID=3077235 RepID=A0ABU3PGU3_9BURK|nr:cytochrome P450 [Paucibacter sp. APW11]MDT9001819.1 cytochrome P450 [Paucibacter sp. APW11]